MIRPLGMRYSVFNSLMASFVTMAPKLLISLRNLFCSSLSVIPRTAISLSGISVNVPSATNLSNSVFIAVSNSTKSADGESAQATGVGAGGNSPSIGKPEAAAGAVGAAAADA